MGLFSKVAKAFDSMKSGYTSAVILCAGNSTRFGKGSENKQMAQVLGKGVAERTISVFEKSKAIKEIIIVVRKEDLQKYK
ncbi:MAG: NTP transferase domain-containing protein, partial [Clostridia bacterium]|nr:NTP transferase domain-containing protein [Clostridia bacterium]